jgi:hypothetical protein
MAESLKKLSTFSRRVSLMQGVAGKVDQTRTNHPSCDREPIKAAFISSNADTRPRNDYGSSIEAAPGLHLLDRRQIPKAIVAPMIRKSARRIR